MAKGGAVDTEARGGSLAAGHARLKKYTIRASWVGDELYWLARVPYGSLNRFHTWAEAVRWLEERHEERKIEEAKRARKRERDSHRHA